MIYVSDYVSYILHLL